jgi:hypothetical protein
MGMMPISDMIKYNDKKNAAAGYLGKDYELKKWHHDVDKPFVVNFHKDVKPRHFMDPMLKSKKNMPAPNAYNVAKDLSVRYNVMNQKSPRVTIPIEIEKREKKLKFPEPATYKPNHAPTESRTKGCFSLKSDRQGYIDECFVRGKE